MKQCNKCNYLGVDAPCARCKSTRMTPVPTEDLDCLVLWVHSDTGCVVELRPGDHPPGYGWTQTGTVSRTGDKSGKTGMDGDDRNRESKEPGSDGSADDHSGVKRADVIRYLYAEADRDTGDQWNENTVARVLRLAADYLAESGGTR